MDVQAGRILRGRYQLGDELGSGATGTVVRAHDMLLDRTVAVKLLSRLYAGDATVVARFYAEARAAAAIADQHVVAVHDVLDDDGAHALVMEYVDGASLATLLREQGRLDEARAVRYARDTALALAAAHARGVLHRDIKPANLLLAANDTVKVTDFGLAKAIEADVALTEPGRLLGSVAYISPEQAQGAPVGPTSDLYSLGVVLHQLVTGHLPFTASSPLSAAIAHVQQPVPAQETLAREMSPGLAAIVHRLLQKDPSARFTTAADLVRALDTVTPTADGGTADWDAPTIVTPIPVTPPPRLTADVRRAAAQPAAQLAAGIVVLLALLGTGIAGTLRHPVAAAVVKATPAPAVAARPPATVVVPPVTGHSLQYATDTLTQAGLRPNVAARIDESPVNTVIATYPVPGTRVARGSPLLVVISTGPQPHILQRDNGPAFVPPGWRHKHGHHDGGDGGD